MLMTSILHGLICSHLTFFFSATRNRGTWKRGRRGEYGSFFLLKIKGAGGRTMDFCFGGHRMIMYWEKESL